MEDQLKHCGPPMLSWEGFNAFFLQLLFKLEQPCM